jgi:bacterioferritin-associated ferredoxin
MEDLVICRCEVVKESKIREAIKEGFDTFSALRKYLRCGMGPCQGKYCRDNILKILKEETGREDTQLCIQPPVRPIKIKFIQKPLKEGE